MKSQLTTLTKHFSVKNDRLNRSIASGVTAITVLVGMGLVTRPAEATTFTTPTPLSDLLSGANQFQVGSNIFSGFFYTPAGDAKPTYANAANITVSGDTNTPGSPGIVFNGGFSGTTAGGGDIRLGFVVNGVSIGAGLSIDGNVPPSTFIDSETIRQGSFVGPVVALLNVNTTNSNAIGIFGQAYSQLFVTQDIGPGSSGSFNFSIDNKAFLNNPVPPKPNTDQVPEPSSVLSPVAFGALFGGYALVRRRKQKMSANLNKVA